MKISQLKFKKDLGDYLVTYFDEASEHRRVSSGVELHEPVSSPPKAELASHLHGYNERKL